MSTVGWLMKRAVQIALLGIVGLLVAFAFVAFGEAPWMPSAKWLGLTVYTPLVFGGVGRDFRRSWHRVTFWPWLGGLLVFHTAIYTVVLTTVDEWRLIWFLPISIVEFPALVFILQALGYDDRPVPPRRNAPSRMIS